MTLSLYDLSDEVLALDDLAAMDEGEWTDEHQQLADELMDRLVVKADSFGGFVRNLEARADACSAEIQRLQARKKSAEARIDWMKRYALSALTRMGRPRIEGELFTIAIQNNPPKVEVDVLPGQLPSAFVRVIPEVLEVNKSELAKALKGGEEIPGCRLVQTQSVRVK